MDIRSCVAAVAIGAALVIGPSAAPVAGGRSVVAQAGPSSAPKDSAMGRFEGSLRRGPDSSWSLVVAFGKRVAVYALQFTGGSVCAIGPDEGLCTAFMTFLGSGGPSLGGGGDNVTVEGDQQGDSIVVRRLMVKENFAVNGTLTEATVSGQNIWSLTYQLPADDAALQPPGRPTSTIPLQFDAHSLCGDGRKIDCTSFALQANAPVFVRGLRYKGDLIVRQLTLIDARPALPR